MYGTRDNRVRSFAEVVSAGLCIGCGACYGLGGRGSPLSLEDTPSGIRPKFDYEASAVSEHISVCPGATITDDLHEHHTAAAQSLQDRNADLIGPCCSVMVGSAADTQTRFQASSGGIITALCSYCLDTGLASYVVHTASDPNRPWANETVVSRTRDELLSRAGSRYVTSSPCEAIPYILHSPEPCVFVGKPCDVAAMRAAIRAKPAIGERVQLLLTFFCAGTPSSRGPQQLVSSIAGNPELVCSVRYRGNGWPGRFRVVTGDGNEQSLSYEESWGFIQKYRPLRCYLCADGLGQVADVSSGDAWDRHDANNPGLSYLLVRTERGQQVVEAARRKGYLDVRAAKSDDVVAAQGLVERRRQMYGRILSRSIFGLPSPRYEGFDLVLPYRRLPVAKRIRVIVGTVRRIVARRQWRRQEHRFKA